MSNAITAAWWEILILLLIPTALYTCQIVFHNKIKKVFNNYWVWIGIAIAYLAYFIGVVWTPNIIDCPSSAWGHSWSNPLDSSGSRHISWVFCLDVCQFAALFIPIAIIADPTRKVARTLAPTAIVGGVFTLITRVIFDADTTLSLRYIFIGVDYPNHAGFYMYHVVNMALAIGLLLNTPKANKRGLLQMTMLQCAYYAYVGIIIAATTATYSVAGLTFHDFMEGGNFKQIGNAFGSPYLALVLFHIVTFGCAIGIWALNDYVFKTRAWKYGNVLNHNRKEVYNYNKFTKLPDFWRGFKKIKQSKNTK